MSCGVAWSASPCPSLVRFGSSWDLLCWFVPGLLKCEIHSRLALRARRDSLFGVVFKETFTVSNRQGHRGVLPASLHHITLYLVLLPLLLSSFRDIFLFLCVSQRLAFSSARKQVTLDTFLILFSLLPAAEHLARGRKVQESRADVKLLPLAAHNTFSSRL